MEILNLLDKKRMQKGKQQEFKGSCLRGPAADFKSHYYKNNRIISEEEKRT